jgi:hypothetical protein
LACQQPAQKRAFFDKEIIPVVLPAGNHVTADDGPRSARDLGIRPPTRIILLKLI